MNRSPNKRSALSLPSVSDPNSAIPRARFGWLGSEADLHKVDNKLLSSVNESSKDLGKKSSMGTMSVMNANWYNLS